jgi:glycosyltransferase involved in cell wall biosynthesis
MKILYLTPFPPTRSGVADYAKCFQEALHQFSEWELKVPQYEKQILGNSIADLRIIYDEVKKWKLDGLFDEISMIHVELGCMNHREFYALIIIKYLYPSLPYFITIHDPSVVIAPSLYFLAFGSESKLLRHFFRVLDYTPIGQYLTRRVLSQASNLFVLSETGAEAINTKNITRTKIKVIPHVNYRISIDENTIRSGQEKKTVEILFMGFWGKGKGLETLIDAMEQVVKNSKFEVKLLLGGGSIKKDYKDSYIDFIKDKINASHAVNNIKILGYIDPLLVNYHLDNADIFVLPYGMRGSSSSGALHRALSSGIAIVTSGIGSLCEDVQHLENGMLVKPDDLDELATALIQLVNDRDLRLKLGENAQIRSFIDNSREKVSSVVSKTYFAGYLKA